ncbi:predicted protein [Arabidopsis lyrata subsp. lyrata]|uniref:Predicted protein n=1 Tax=Arabidopsis lyrata subsp. lyrata TaxID=81972 RepID=D7KW13_ARALL|nr:predicted protein [Arabidopsis lyrata subsp. lyrata]
MEDSGAILCQISIFKDMLDQVSLFFFLFTGLVNREIEANIQVTREIESHIGNCSEMESSLSVKEAELTKSFIASQFEISGLISVTADSRNSLKLLEDDICRLRNEHSELITRLTEKR